VIIGDFSQISSICKDAKIDRIVVALDERRGKLPFEELLGCRLKGIQVDDGVAFMEAVAGRLSLENIYPSSLIFSEGFKESLIFKKGKRFFDLFFSILGLLLFLPFGILVAIAIKMDSQGPVFYEQERIGQDEKRFRLKKFRSMRQDAEKNGPVWAMVADQRATRVGALIRKLRIDEVPQMINVIKGEMSFVGPRPERPFFVRKLENEIPYYSHRHIVKPGITGWAQICYPYGASEEDALEKLKYDMYYIKKMSLVFDLTIILETIKAMIGRKGAR
jgi:sugar transferase (PEP-CTERM system associated)